MKTYGNRENPVIVMLPGLACSFRSLEGIVHLLSNRYYCIIPSLLAFAELSYQKQADMLIEQLSAVHVHMLYGVSTSCAIVMEMMKSKQFTADYYFFESAPFYKTVSIVRNVAISKLCKAIEEAKKVSFERFKDVLTHNDMIHNLAGDLSSDYDELIKDMYDHMQQLSKKSIDVLVRSVTDYRLPKVNREAQEKMIFSYGKLGPLWTVRMKMLDCYPFAAFITYKDNGYCGLMYQNPEAYASKLIEKID